MTALALIGAITVAVLSYRVRWLFAPASWRRGSPWLGLPWGMGGS